MHLENFSDNPHLASILNAITDGILISDGNGKVLWLNRTCENLANTPRASMIGENIATLEEQGIFMPSVTKLVLEKQTTVSTVQTAGNNQKFIVSGHPVKDTRGKIQTIIAHSRNITEIARQSNELEDLQSLLNRYSQEITKHNYQQLLASSDKHYIGKNKEYASFMDTVDRVAATESTVLITGETGTGKNVIAQRIHDLSERSNKSIIEINCGAIPESLIESELFGYAKGAFTGASQSGKAGLIKLADKGTLFLDEIGELPLHLQAKLLQFLQEGIFRPVGSTDEDYADVRIIAATNLDLVQAVHQGTFRSDLFYRINVLPLHVPPVRKRQDDILGLIYFYLERYNHKYQKNCKLSGEVLHALQDYDWPGNIRELENLVERLVVIADEDDIDADDLPFHIVKQKANHSSYAYELPGENLTEKLENVEKKMIVEAYAKYKTTRKAAQELGITQSLFMRRMKKYSIS